MGKLKRQIKITTAKNECGHWQVRAEVMVMGKPIEVSGEECFDTQTEAEASAFELAEMIEQRFKDQGHATFIQQVSHRLH